MTPIEPGPILFCYDGSEGARRAIEWTGALRPGARAIVLHLWDRPASAPSARAAKDRHTRAVAIAAEGVELAAAAGLRARPLIAGLGVSWQSILSVAEEEGAVLIVTGADGVSGDRALLGSLSKGVAQHAHVTVLVVPPPPGDVPTTVYLHERPVTARPAASLTISVRMRKATGVAGSVATRQTMDRPDAPPPVDTGML